MSEVTEMDFVMMLIVYAVGFGTGGVLFYEIGKQRSDKQNIERVNKILGWHLDNPEVREDDE